VIISKPVWRSRWLFVLSEVSPARWRRKAFGKKQLAIQRGWLNTLPFKGRARVGMG
jgi:hypothetical protein